MEYDPDKYIDQYFIDGWTLYNVGSAPERTQSTPDNLRAQRRQYGLKHRVTSTIHVSMGDTLYEVAMEISDIDNSYKLWGKRVSNCCS